MELGGLKEAAKTGQGPTTLKEKQSKAEKQKRAEKKRKITFRNFFEKTYFPVSKLTKKPESYRKEEEHFKNWLNSEVGNKPMQDIFPLHLERIKKSILDAERAPRTIQYVFATFRQCWNMARRDGIVVRESPTKQVKVPKVDNRRMRYLTYEQAETLLEKLKLKSPKVHDMSLISLHCGLRAGEIFKIRWGDLDFNTGTIRVRDPKGRPARTAYTTEMVKDALSCLERRSHDDLVFKSEAGGQIKKMSNTFERVVKDMKLNDGIEDKRQKIVFHSLRHTFASWLVQDGENLYSVMELMGHSTLLMTERYSHLAEDNLKAAVKNFEKNLRDKRKEKKKVIALKQKED
jgi:integrase